MNVSHLSERTAAGDSDGQLGVHTPRTQYHGGTQVKVIKHVSTTKHTCRTGETQRQHTEITGAKRTKDTFLYFLHMFVCLCIKLYYTIYIELYKT